MDAGQRLGELGPSPAAPLSLQWVVSLGEPTLRLDTFLGPRLPMIGRREIAEWITAGQIRVNGRRGKKSDRLQAGDTVTVTTGCSLSPNPTLPVRVLYSNPAFVVLDKPSGVPSVARRHSDTNTVANFLYARFPETAAVSPRPLEAGVVHRLDTATSGVLLAARIPDAYTALRTQFAEHLVVKTYTALVEGRLRQRGQRTSSLAPTGPKGQRMHEAAQGDGQYAETFYAPLETSPRHTLVRIEIMTGVRHQIRAHLAVAGHPIVGDVLYGASTPATRLCLHARSVSLSHPLTGGKTEFASPLPEDFLQELRRVGWEVAHCNA